MIKINFSVSIPFPVLEDQFVFVTGSSVDFGSWNIRKALKLKKIKEGLWAENIYLTDSLQFIYFIGTYVRTEKDNKKVLTSIRWEKLSKPHCLTFSAINCGGQLLHYVFGEESADNTDNFATNKYQVALKMPGDLCMKTKLDVMRMVSYKENCRQAEEDRDRVQELNNNLTQQNLMQQQTIQRLEQRIEELTEERELNRQTIRASNAAIMHLVNPHNQQEVQQPQQLQQQQPLNRQQEVNPQANYYQNHYQQMHYQPQRQLQMHNNPQPNIPQQPPNYQHLQPNIQQQPPNYQHLQPNIQQQPANYQQQYPPNNQIQFNFQPNINNVQINFMLFDEQQPVFCFADKSFRDSLDHLTYGGMLKRIKAKKTKTSEGLFKPFTPETTPKTTFDSTKVIELTKIVNASEPSELPQLFSFKPQDFADVEVSLSTQTINNALIAPSLKESFPITTTSIPITTITSTPLSTTTPLTTNISISSKSNDNLSTIFPLKETEKAPENPKENEKEKLNVLPNNADEGMEDELIIVAEGPPQSTTTKEQSISSLNFNFMGGLGTTSTPINANSNPFGSINSKPSNIFGSPLQQHPPPSFGTSFFGNSAAANNAFGSSSTNQSGAFGSFNTVTNTGSSGFGASPFASVTAAQSAFGAAPIFRKNTSPFASHFGNVANTGSNTTIGSGDGGEGSLMFGGGVKSNGCGSSTTTTGLGTTGGFSAFASKSTAFGQLARQHNEQQQNTSSLFGGGGSSSNTPSNISGGGGGTFFGGFGGSPTSSNIGPVVGQQKS